MRSKGIGGAATNKQNGLWGATNIACQKYPEVGIITSSTIYRTPCLIVFLPNVIFL